VTSAAFFGVFRHERDGVFDDEARRRMRLIVPHIRRAVLVGRLVDLKKVEAATLAETLDGLSAGMCLVDADCRVVHANAAAHIIFNRRDLLYVSGGRLVASDMAVAQILRELFAAAGSGGDSAVGIKGIALPLMAENGDRYVANILPLTSGARSHAGIAVTAVAALFIHKASLTIQPPPQIIAQHYKLTPTELRVLLAIVEVGGVPEVAEALGIADSTVKSHVGRLFQKTGTHRQADLVKLVAGFSSPLLS
jgi:DNA-binding CsgD family transcriptional regulator